MVQAFQPPPPPFLYLSKRRFSRGSLSSFPFDLNSESQTLLHSMYSADLRASRCIVRFILSTFTLLLLSFFCGWEEKSWKLDRGWRISRAFSRNFFSPLVLSLENKENLFAPDHDCKFVRTIKEMETLQMQISPPSFTIFLFVEL